MTFAISSGTSPPTRFVVLATQRTGSTWLTDMLDSHPAIVAHEELFLPVESHRRVWGRTDQEFFSTYFARRANRRSPVARLVWSLRYLEELYSPKPATEAIGLKLMYGQLKALPWLVPYLVVRRVRVVHLVRKNLLDLVLSRETAKARSQYHALSSDVVDQSPIHVRTDQLVSQLQGLQRYVDGIRMLLRLLPAPSIEVSYEELVTGAGALDQLLRFLNVAPHSLNSRLTRLNRATKQELIANYEDVERVLRGTRFEHFLTR